MMSTTADTTLSTNNSTDTTGAQPMDTTTDLAKTVIASDHKAEANQNSVQSKDNGTEEVDDSQTPSKKIKLSNDVNDEPKTEIATPPSAGRGRPAKGSKRLNILEKTAKEGEALLQNLGHKGVENPGEGNRRSTRSQTRGTPPAAPTPPKKVATPKSPSKDSSSGTPKRRGRPPKSSVSSNNSVDDKSDAIDATLADDTKTDANDVSDTDGNASSTAAVNNEPIVNNTSDESTPAVASDESEPKSAPEVVPKPSAEQTPNDVKKANSISDDTSKPSPVLETTQAPPLTSE